MYTCLAFLKPEKNMENFTLNNLIKGRSIFKKQLGNFKQMKDKRQI